MVVQRVDQTQSCKGVEVLYRVRRIFGVLWDQESSHTVRVSFIALFRGILLTLEKSMELEAAGLLQVELAMLALMVPSKIDHHMAERY